MMPLVLADPGKPGVIARVGGNAEVKQHLNNLGFVVGNAVTVISSLSGNVIVSVLDARVAISRELAQKILIQ